MEANIKKAVIYCRVSTKEQVEDGNSLVTQEKLCREYATKHFYEVVEVFIEQGESAKTTERPELQRLLNYCTVKKNNIQAVIAYKLDRISRDTDGYSEIRILLKTKGVQIKSVTEYFENTPAGKFMENIIANVAQFDNDVRTERSVTGMKEAMREGRYVWNAAFGYSNVKVAGKSTIAPNEHANLVKRLFLEVAKNQRSMDAIRKDPAFRLDKTHPVMSRTGFYRLLKNQIYIGKIKKFGEIHWGTFQPIIEEELFNQVQRVVSGRKKAVADFKKDHPDFPLRRFVEHYPSGMKLTGSWCKGRNKKYPYYRFRKQNKSYSTTFMESIFMHFINLFAIDENDFAVFAKELKKNLTAKIADNQKAYFQSQKRIEELKARETALVEKNYKGTINDDVLDRQLSMLSNELQREYGNLYSLEDKKPNYTHLLYLASDYLKNPAKIWQSASFDKKLALQRFQFPEGIIFDGQNVGTKKIASIFNLNRSIFDELSPEGSFKLGKSNKLSITSFKTEGEKILFWQGVGNNLEQLGQIFQISDTNNHPP